MKNELLESAIKVVTALSGAAAALYLFWSDNEKEKKEEPITRGRIVGFLVMGGIGTYFIAPLINNYFEFSEAISSSVSFLCAVFTDIVLMFIYKLIKSLISKVEDIAIKIIDKYLS